MKIKFDSNQQYQLDAIYSIVDIFEGQPLAQSTYEIRFDEASTALQMSELGIGNRLVVTEPNILGNIQKVQTRNGIDVSEELQGMNFSIEMETGTGKTYVYLRTLYELNTRYGFRKFVIVVPSVAIREGIMSSIELTKVSVKPPAPCFR